LTIQATGVAQHNILIFYKNPAL